MASPERAARYSDLFDSGNPPQHPNDCAYCPICATIGVLRNVSPELFEHLGAAAREFLLAAGVFLDEAAEMLASHQGPPRAAHDGDQPHNVHRIDFQ
ncbi:MAG TPA: hypothetical protein VHJ82_10345 [Actinomycetota bacterium]|nr:hypothetical protein [Actinomycetota bacterium]